MNGDAFNIDFCCICERLDYSLRMVSNETGCRWVTLELTNQPVTWFVACALCLSKEWRRMKTSVDLDEMQHAYCHATIQECEQTIEKNIKDKLVQKAYIEPADVEDAAVVRLTRFLRDSEIQEIQEIQMYAVVEVYK